MKRLLDLVVSLLGLLTFSPLLMVVIFLVWMQDKKSPFYIATRVGQNEKNFNMVKLRSMVINADKTGVDSTSASDTRITPIGHFIRKYKLDELTQLWNVFCGDMSLVGPRPNVKNDTDLYTSVERELLSVKPGITDFSSIVFSDEGEILNNKEDPDLSYNQLIRPWKSRLGLIYIENRTFFLDIKLIFFTLIAIISKERAIQWLSGYLDYLGVDEKVVAISKRKLDLYAFPPPGSKDIVTAR
tara:strand:+ start:31811 stop:32536 length:726 start_codon:yes stop_codon:yes gene_type:complete